jgi:hypothetical protein
MGLSARRSSRALGGWSLSKAANMKKLIYVAIFAVVTFCITTDALSSAQRCQRRSKITKISSIEEAEKVTLEERAKITDECLSPGVKVTSFASFPCES